MFGLKKKEVQILLKMKQKCCIIFKIVVLDTIFWPQIS